jgi:hypothetical protein
MPAIEGEAKLVVRPGPTAARASGVPLAKTCMGMLLDPAPNLLDQGLGAAAVS